MFKSPVSADKDYMDMKTPLETLGFDSFDSKMVPMRPIGSAEYENHIQSKRMTTRSSRFQESALAAAVKTVLSRVPRTATNPTLHQARAGPDWPEWNEAIQKEIAMLNDLGCFEWILQSQIPSKKQILNSKMDLRTKVDAHGVKIKCKARLVALGNQEWES